MDIPYLINLLQNKLNYLSNARASAAAVGDVSAVTAIDQDFTTTQNTLAQLQLLLSVTQMAAATNASASDLLNSAVASAQMQGPSASAVINGYDISAYATDALYESKVQAILDGMPSSFEDAASIDVYIQGNDPGSPVTGLMVTRAAGAYNVDIPLLLAIMELDSQFGTQGVGATTNNPGNVGNTGTATQTFNSWDEGVMAVAQWLNNHRTNTDTSTDTTASTDTSSVTPDTAASSTPSVATTTPDTASTTPDIAATPDTASTTPDIATTTPDNTATTTDSTATTTDTSALP